MTMENDGVQAWECVLTYDVIKEPVVDECGCIYERNMINEVFKRATEARAAAEKRRAEQFLLPGDERLLQYAPGEIPCPRTTKPIHANRLIKSEQVRELCKHITTPQPAQRQPSMPAGASSSTDKIEAMFDCLLQKMSSLENRMGTLESVIAVQHKQLNNAFNISGCEMVRLLLPTSVCGIPLGGINMKDVTDKNLSERDFTILYHHELNSSSLPRKESDIALSKEGNTSKPKIAEKVQTNHSMQEGYGIGSLDTKENDKKSA